MRADRRFDEADLATAHHPHVKPVRDAMDVPYDHAKPAARRDIRRDTQTDRRDRERHDHFQPLALAIAQPLAVAPGRELDPRWLPDADEVVALPPNQRDLVRRGGNAPLTRHARERFDPLQPVVKGSEIPATASGTHDPEPALPLIEREPPAHAQPRGSTIAVKVCVAEGTTAK